MNIEEINDREWDVILPPTTGSEEVNVDKAWNLVRNRAGINGNVNAKEEGRTVIFRSIYFRIAASLLLLIAMGSALIYILNPDSLSRQVIIATEADEARREITLPDGSTVILNRNTRLAYNASFEGSSRNVTLSGEAFFDIKPDPSKPFIIDAGRASVRVVGTSFNVITENNQKFVEVFVQSGKVILTDNSGSRNITLDPGYVGKMNASDSARELNTDPNYMSWNTGILVYDGQTLEKVFSDLKRVFNMNITAEDPSILNNTWTSPIDIESRDTIIRLICTSFNLDYVKDGDSYHLKKK